VFNPFAILRRYYAKKKSKIEICTMGMDCLETVIRAKLREKPFSIF
jgi:hypothetical protein